MLSNGPARGAAAGTAATVLMSVVMLAAQRLGLMGRQPPSRIAEAALDAGDDDGDDRPGRTAVKALAVPAHFAFGAGGGALYALLAGRRAGPVSGGAYGLAVWAANYAGWVPQLRIMPPPSEDRPGRPVAMVLAHLVYGSALGALIRAWAGRAPRTRRALSG